jgi:hypothetical protein
MKTTKNKNGSEKRKGPSFGLIGFVFLIIKIITTGNRGTGEEKVEGYKIRSVFGSSPFNKNSIRKGVTSWILTTSSLGKFKEDLLFNS